MRAIYPFTAIVGQERMKRALILNAVDTRIGGVLIRGERGTAKSTAARALAALLPQVRVVSDCRFACDPDKPETWCTECRERADKGEELPTEIVRTPFIDLPVSATEDRVVGTLNIEEAIRKGERHFEPGILASANRGLLYIDEVNLLDDHVVDILLDSAAMGMNIVEREGISFTHPARFILVGTMNPEEGELRPQLLDRFGLSVEIHGISTSRERVAIMQRHLAFEQNTEEFRQEWLEKEEELSKKIEKARSIVDQVTYTSRDLVAIAHMTSSMNVEGHRADLVILKAARAQAAFEGRTRITDFDIGLVAELALLHRMRGGPMQMSEMDADELHAKIEKLVGFKDPGQEEEPSSPSDKQESSKKKNISGEETAEPTAEDSEMPVPPQKAFEQVNANWWEGGQRIRVGEAFTPRRLDTPLDKLVRRYGGRRSQTQTSRRRGRYIQARPANGDLSDIAFDATLRAAAPFQKKRADETDGLAFHVHSDDFMKKIRVRRAANLILFLVDASWSMAVAERMSATKGAIVSLLTDAYQRRDKVGLIVFQKDRATLILPPTNSIQLAQRALKNIPVGGKTPLSAGLAMASEVIKRELMVHPDVKPILIVMTDGAGNVAMGAYAPLEEAYQLAEKIAHEDINSVVINMETETYDQGLAYTLAKKLDAPCLTIKELKAEHLYMAVRQVRDDIQRNNS